MTNQITMKDIEGHFGSLKRFHHPPLVEVVCAIQIERLDSLNVKSILDFYYDEWEEDYQNWTPKQIMRSLTGSKGIEIYEDAPCPRFWFLNENDSQLIQLQQDRFVYNWRKTESETDYIHFKNVKPEFLKRFSEFEKYMAAQGFGEVNPEVVELTYINHLPITPDDPLLPSLNNVSNIFPDLVWPFCLKEQKVGSVQNARYYCDYELPFDGGALMVNIFNGSETRNNSPVVAFELKAQGTSSAIDDMGLETWFDLAHHGIVKTFEELTDTTVHEKYWRLK